jgi:hypothetical protein
MNITTLGNFKFFKNVGGTETVIDTSKPTATNYIGHVWHDEEASAILGMPYWNINNGYRYLDGFATREKAVQAMIEAKASNQ